MYEVDMLKVPAVSNNGGCLPDMILLTVDPMLLNYYRGTRLKAMNRCCLCSLCMIPPKRFDIFSFFPPYYCGMLRRSRCVQIFL